MGPKPRMWRHDQAGSDVSRLINGNSRRITLAKYPASVEMIQRSAEEVIQGFVCFLPRLYVERGRFGREIVNSGNDMEQSHSDSKCSNREIAYRAAPRQRSEKSIGTKIFANENIVDASQVHPSARLRINARRGWGNNPRKTRVAARKISAKVAGHAMAGPVFTCLPLAYRATTIRK